MLWKLKNPTESGEAQGQKIEELLAPSDQANSGSLTKAEAAHIIQAMAFITRHENLDAILKEYLQQPPSTDPKNDIAGVLVALIKVVNNAHHKG